MRKSLLRRPSAALVVACVALFVALGGGAYAAFNLPKNSVGSKQIKNGAVVNSKLANNSVATGKIRNGAVTASKINATGLTVPNATNATNATNAANLGGLAPSSYTTESNFSQGSPNQTIGNAFATVGSVSITTDGTKRLIGMAAVHAVNGTAGTGAYLVCRNTVDGTAGVNDTAYAAPFGQTIVDASVSPLASAVVGAGTHTVTLQCEALPSGQSMKVVDDALAGWAVSG
jgi:hypothetical protein